MIKFELSNLYLVAWDEYDTNLIYNYDSNPPSLYNFSRHPSLYTFFKCGLLKKTKEKKRKALKIQKGNPTSESHMWTHPHPLKPSKLRKWDPGTRLLNSGSHPRIAASTPVAGGGEWLRRRWSRRRSSSLRRTHAASTGFSPSSRGWTRRRGSSRSVLPFFSPPLFLVCWSWDFGD